MNWLSDHWPLISAAVGLAASTWRRGAFWRGLIRLGAAIYLLELSRETELARKEQMAVMAEQAEGQAERLRIAEERADRMQARLVEVEARLARAEARLRELGYALD